MTDSVIFRVHNLPFGELDSLSIAGMKEREKTTVMCRKQPEDWAGEGSLFFIVNRMTMRETFSVGRQAHRFFERIGEPVEPVVYSGKNSKDK